MLSQNTPVLIVKIHYAPNFGSIVSNALGLKTMAEQNEFLDKIEDQLLNENGPVSKSWCEDGTCRYFKTISFHGKGVQVTCTLQLSSLHRVRNAKCVAHVTAINIL